MKKRYLHLLGLLFSFICVISSVNAQTTINTGYSATTSTGSGGNGITFAIENTNATAQLLTDVGYYLTSSHSNTVYQLWVSTTSLSGPQPTSYPATGWTLVAQVTTGTITTTGIQNIFTGLSHTIPASTTHRFSLVKPNAGPQYASSGSTVLSAAGVNLLLGAYQIGGQSVGYAATIANRYWAGSITFQAAIPCNNPPTPGTATASPISLSCPNGNVNLNLTGNSSGGGQTYQWESSPNGTTGWTAISGSLFVPAFTVNPTATAWYRCKVQCGTGTPVYSTTVQVSVSGSAMSGTYTVNAALPTAGTNFNNFEDLIDELMTCGVTGPTTINVAPNSGPYNETFYIGNIPGSSATNKVRINGNGNTIQANTTSTNPHLLRITSTRYLTIDNMIFKSLNATYGWGCHFMDGGSQHAYYDSITNCTFDLTSVTGSSSIYGNGITFSGSLTSASSAGTNIARNCYIGGNKVLGAPNTMYGIYFGMTIMQGCDSLTIENNIISNFYLYGMYIYNSSGSINNLKIRNNTLHRADKISPSTFYGIYSYGARTNGDFEISGNRIHSPGGQTGATGTCYGLYVSSANVSNPSALRIFNNSLYNLNQGGTLYALYVANGGVNTKILHNTINIAASTTSTAYGMYLSGTYTSGELKNNNVTFSATMNATAYGYYHSTLNGFPQANVQRNNIWRGATPNAATYHSYHGGAHTLLTNLQTAYPAMEVGSVSVDPMYINAALGDMEPSNGALLNNGLNLSGQVPNDINGMPRATTPTPGAFEMPPPVPNNARMLGIPAPMAFCPGVNDVVVNVNNAGINNITSLQIHWTVNGVPQTPYNWTGNLTPSTNTNITIGNYNFLTGVIYNIKAWTYLPNGSPDPQPANDTFQAVRRSSLSGSFTINSALPTGGTNYQNFNAFSNDLNEYGICGPVVAEVVVGSGPYNERVQFGNIVGASPVNTIRIHGNGETIRYNSTSTTEMPIVTLNGTKYMTIDSLHIQTLSPSYGWGVHIYGGAQHDSIKRCHIDLSSITTSSSTNSAIALSGSSTSPTTAGSASEIYIGDNKIVGGANNNMYGCYYLITIMGSIGTSGPNTGANNITLNNNDISNFYYMAVYAYGLNNGKITNNNIHKKDRNVVTGSMYGIYAYYWQGGEIASNRLHDFSTTGVSSVGTFYGIITYAYYNVANTPIYVYNNALYNLHTYTSTNYILYFNTSKFTHYYHNTVNVNAIQNNSNTIYALYMPTSTITQDCSIINNMITFTGGSTGTKYGIYVSSSAYDVEMQKNNVYFNTTQAGAQYWGYYGGNYATLGAFQTAYPAKEIGSLENDPLYVDEVNGNMQPQDLLFYENGNNLLPIVTKDIYGFDRTSTPTPGAFEIGPCDVFNTGVVELVTPVGQFCSGDRTVQVRIENAGLNDLDSVWVHWTFNGVPQPPVNYVANIANRNTAPFNTAIVLLGDVFVPWGMTSTISVWTSLPNSEIDKCNENDTLTVSLNPTSTIPTDLGPDTLICDGYELILSAGPQAIYNYRWDDNSTQNQRSVYSAGTYYVLKSDLQGECAGHDTIVVTTNPSPTVYLGPDSAVCMGKHVILDAGIANVVNDILWDNNDTGQFRDVHIAGVYSVTVTNEFGCQDSDEFELFYKDVPVNDGINAVYMLDLTYNFNLINPLYVADVVWDFGDGSPVDTGMFVTHKYKKHGLYNVSILMLSTCDGGDPVKETFTLDAIGLGVSEIDNSDFKLYPNPSTEKLNIEVTNAQIEAVSVYNVLGQLVSTEELKLQSSKYQINVANLSSGMYTIKVITDKGQLIRKFEVVR